MTILVCLIQGLNCADFGTLTVPSLVVPVPTVRSVDESQWRAGSPQKLCATKGYQCIDPLSKGGPALRSAWTTKGNEDHRSRFHLPHIDVMTERASPLFSGSAPAGEPCFSYGEPRRNFGCRRKRREAGTGEERLFETLPVVSAHDCLGLLFGIIRTPPLAMSQYRGTMARLG